MILVDSSHVSSFDALCWALNSNSPLNRTYRINSPKHWTILCLWAFMSPAALFVMDGCERANFDDRLSETLSQRVISDPKCLSKHKHNMSQNIIKYIALVFFLFPFFFHHFVHDIVIDCALLFLETAPLIEKGLEIGHKCVETEIHLHASFLLLVHVDVIGIPNTRDRLFSDISSKLLLIGKCWGNQSD